MGNQFKTNGVKATNRQNPIWIIILVRERYLDTSLLREKGRFKYVTESMLRQRGSNLSWTMTFGGRE